MSTLSRTANRATVVTGRVRDARRQFRRSFAPPTVIVPPMPDALVAAEGLTKQFGDFSAVRGIDFQVMRGEAFGFLGPNGAGKSSTMRMIACVSPISGGSLRVLGRDPATHGSEL